MAKGNLKFIKSFTQDPFWKNVLTLFSGSILAQAILILIYPILTRIYSKEEIGVYFIYVSVVMVVQIISSFQYHLTIILPSKNSDAGNLLSINVFLLLITSSIYFIIILLFEDTFTRLIDEKRLVRWLLFIPLSTFFLGSTSALTYYFNRFKKYKKITTARIIRSCSIAIFQLLFGILNHKTTGMITGLLLADFLCLSFLIINIPGKRKNILNININQSIQLLKKYKDIPIYNTLLSFLNTLSNQLPILLLPRFFGVNTASDYGLSNRVVNTPMGMIATSVGQVFFRESSEHVNNGKDLHKLVKNTYTKLFKIAIIPFLTLFIFAPFLFELFFTEHYANAGIYTRILIPWFFMGFLNLPVTFLLTTLNKQKIFVQANTLLLISRTLALFAGYFWFKSAIIALALFSFTGVAYNIFIFFYLLHISKIDTKGIYNKTEQE